MSTYEALRGGSSFSSLRHHSQSRRASFGEQTEERSVGESERETQDTFFSQSVSEESTSISLGFGLGCDIKRYRLPYASDHTEC